MGHMRKFIAVSKSNGMWGKAIMNSGKKTYDEKRPVCYNGVDWMEKPFLLLITHKPKPVLIAPRKDTIWENKTRGRAGECNWIRRLSSQKESGGKKASRRHAFEMRYVGLERTHKQFRIKQTLLRVRFF